MGEPVAAAREPVAAAREPAAAARELAAAERELVVVAAALGPGTTSTRRISRLAIRVRFGTGNDTGASRSAAGCCPTPNSPNMPMRSRSLKRYQEALDVLDTLENPNTPRALNYRGYATRKLGRTDEGITYYLKSVAIDPNYPQVREYLGEAYVIQGKFDLAKDQLATIEKLCGSKECEYYEDLAEALDKAHAL